MAFQLYQFVIIFIKLLCNQKSKKTSIYGTFESLMHEDKQLMDEKFIFLHTSSPCLFLNG